MKPGAKRLIERFKNKDNNLSFEELKDDIKAMETEAPELADIMKRMIAAEVVSIQKEKAAS